jgi:hypothetical protein
MTSKDEKQAESWGRKVGAFLSGLFADKKSLLIGAMLLGFGADKGMAYFEPKETYWDEKEITQVIAKAIQEELSRPGSKMDRLAASMDALIKAQSPAVRLAIFEELARYDRRAANPRRENP